MTRQSTQADRQADKQTNRQPDKQTNRQTDTEEAIPTGAIQGDALWRADKAGRQTGRQTSKQTNRHRGSNSNRQKQTEAGRDIGWNKRAPPCTWTGASARKKTTTSPCKTRAGSDNDGPFCFGSGLFWRPAGFDPLPRRRLAKAWRRVSTPKEN